MMRIYWITNLKSGELGMMARPRGNDWLMDEILNLKRKGVDIVISLLERHEIEDLELEDERKYCEKEGIEYKNFPIADRHVPDNVDVFNQLVQELVGLIRENKKIVVHCRMGIGRTSVLVGAILLKLNVRKDGLFEYLSEIRTLEVPDTKQQKDWILNL